MALGETIGGYIGDAIGTGFSIGIGILGLGVGAYLLITNPAVIFSSFEWVWSNALEIFKFVTSQFPSDNINKLAILGVILFIVLLLIIKILGIGALL